MPLLATALVLAAVLAQSGEPPSRDPGTDPGVTNPAVDDRALEQQKKQLNTDPVLPAKAPSGQSLPAATPNPAADLVVPGAKVYPEGAFLTSRTGTLLRARSGEVILVANPPKDGEAPDPPMILHPCALLTQLIGAVEAGSQTTVTLAGQVFQYRSRHYLLPTVFSISTTPALPPMPERPEGPAPTPAPAAETDPAASDLIRELESERAPRAMDPVRPSEKADEPAKSIVASEGTLLVGKRARLVRLDGARGSFAASFDNDPNSPAGGTMVLLPCRALERLEAVAAQQGEKLAFKVSGRVFVFNGRNYLLPVLVQPQRPTDVSPMQ